jgi:hypothetical protein
VKSPRGKPRGILAKESKIKKGLIHRRRAKPLILCGWETRIRTWIDGVRGRFQGNLAKPIVSVSKLISLAFFVLKKSHFGALS